MRRVRGKLRPSTGRAAPFRLRTCIRDAVNAAPPSRSSLAQLYPSENELYTIATKKIRSVENTMEKKIKQKCASTCRICAGLLKCENGIVSNKNKMSWNLGCSQIHPPPPLLSVFSVPNCSYKQFPHSAPNISAVRERSKNSPHAPLKDWQTKYDFHTPVTLQKAPFWDCGFTVMVRLGMM